MKLTGNTILITGGGTGIGRGLAEAFHQRGNQVIISGRTQKSLDTTVQANPGMAAIPLDVSDPASIAEFTEKLEKQFPALNGVIHNAGIMRPENVLEDTDVANAEAIFTTNVLGPIRLNQALMPLLKKQASGMIMTVTSGLAFLPLILTPSYSASKAAIHSYTESLRYQLKDTNIDVLELVPPYVQTELMGDHQSTDPQAMPLKDFIKEAMDILENDPEATEILVKRVHLLRYSADQNMENYQKKLVAFNKAMENRTR